MMDTWVRYSVTVYLGLLLAGTLVGGGGATPGQPTQQADQPLVYLTQVTPPGSVATLAPAPGGI